MKISRPQRHLSHLKNILPQKKTISNFLKMYFFFNEKLFVKIEKKKKL